jgi:hypothetical protein
MTPNASAPSQKIMGLISSLLVVYAVICVATYFGNRQLMYFPDPGRVPPAEAGLNGVEEVEIAATLTAPRWSLGMRERRKANPWYSISMVTGQRR